MSAGFPSPAEDYVQVRLDLNDLLIKHPAATFFVRVQGHSMDGAGIRDGDLLVVDRAVSPIDKSVVVAAVGGDLLVKRLRIDGRGGGSLHAEHPDYPPILIDEAGFTVWGVVTAVIHRPK